MVMGWLSSETLILVPFFYILFQIMIYVAGRMYLYSSMAVLIQPFLILKIGREESV